MDILTTDRKTVALRQYKAKVLLHSLLISLAVLKQSYDWM